MEGDETLVSAHSKQLQKMGWKGATANTAAAYLTGYLCGKRALKAGITEAVLDIGMRPAIRGSRYSLHSRELLTQDSTCRMERQYFLTNPGSGANT